MTEAVWHDMECGCYDADFALWEELAGPAPRDVLDLGRGATSFRRPPPWI